MNKEEVALQIFLKALENADVQNSLCKEITNKCVDDCGKILASLYDSIYTNIPASSK